MTYTTVDDVVAYAKVSHRDLGYADSTQFSAFVSSLISEAEDAVERYCRVPAGYFSSAGGTGYTVTEYHDWDPSGRIYLHHLPAVSVSKVEFDRSGWGTAADWSTASSVNYVTDLNAGMVRMTMDSPGHDDQSVRITYSAGYTSTPEGVKLAATIAASNLLMQALRNRSAPTTSEGDQSVRLVRGDALSDEVKALLLPFMRRLAWRG